MQARPPRMCRPGLNPSNNMTLTVQHLQQKPKQKPENQNEQPEGEQHLPTVFECGKNSCCTWYIQATSCCASCYYFPLRPGFGLYRSVYTCQDGAMSRTVLCPPPACRVESLCGFCVPVWIRVWTPPPQDLHRTAESGQTHCWFPGSQSPWEQSKTASVNLQPIGLVLASAFSQISLYILNFQLLIFSAPAHLILKVVQHRQGRSVNPSQA